MVPDQPKAIVAVEQLLSQQIGPVGREIVAVAGRIDREEENALAAEALAKAQAEAEEGEVVDLTTQEEIDLRD